MQERELKAAELSAEYQAFEQLVRKAFTTPKPEFDEAELEASLKAEGAKPTSTQKK